MKKRLDLWSSRGFGGGGCWVADGGRLVGLSAGDVLTPSEAARALRMREADALTWLRDRGLVRAVAGRERVIWGDVLSAIRTGDAPVEVAAPRKPARPTGLRRAGIV
jgi:hypothetical protein